jgi:hypothetical protein
VITVTCVHLEAEKERAALLSSREGDVLCLRSVQATSAFQLGISFAFGAFEVTRRNIIILGDLLVFPNPWNLSKGNL